MLKGVKLVTDREVNKELLAKLGEYHKALRHMPKIGSVNQELSYKVVQRYNDKNNVKFNVFTGAVYSSRLNKWLLPKYNIFEEITRNSSINETSEFFKKLITVSSLDVLGSAVTEQDELLHDQYIDVKLNSDNNELPKRPKFPSAKEFLSKLRKKPELEDPVNEELEVPE